MRKKVTMQKIANFVGVSKFAVSKALSGQTGVSETTRAKIIDAAIMLGYQVNPIDYTNLKKRSNPNVLAPAFSKGYVNVIIPGLQDKEDGAFFWSQVLEGISQALQQNGLGIIIISEYDPDKFPEIMSTDNLIGFIGVGNISTRILLNITKTGLPLVLIDHEDPIISCDTVFMNNFDCVYRLTNHLIQLGHQNFQFIGNINFSKSFRSRWLGYNTSIEEHLKEYRQGKMLITLQEDDFEKRTAEISKTINKLQSNNDMPTAIVCANDAIALSTLQALQDLNIKVPEECSVTGFDNNEEIIKASPCLTTVQVSKKLLGIRAIDVLIRKLNVPYSPAEKLLISGDLVLRGSISYPPQYNK
ncbi:LacI family DNA-binding transcriptional regulator [Halobacillus shinanisalinarum]|uniref:LacI family DNA-binding transcriptional regulator n=1 Tax=Halobacillus shinanisalinarum TaxID=2932258 RepID=A0ABY4GUQ5_9BACI|nr:LacI family DNA-binding transcriptional regulator [Halobacillus shinanisalinarum]UOQ91886.1 LacI family DNA-binding transcriptional regulator [Halobacillus shinanisalinarum]